MLTYADVPGRATSWGPSDRIRWLWHRTPLVNQLLIVESMIVDKITWQMKTTSPTPWVFTNLSVERKRFCLIATQLDPHPSISHLLWQQELPQIVERVCFFFNTELYRINKRIRKCISISDHHSWLVQIPYLFNREKHNFSRDDIREMWVWRNTTTDHTHLLDCTTLDITLVA